MKICEYYRVNEEKMSYILHELALNRIMCKYDPYKNYTEIETYDFQKPYDIIIKHGGEKLHFTSEDINCQHNCVVLRIEDRKIKKWSPVFNV